MSSLLRSLLFLPLFPLLFLGGLFFAAPLYAETLPMLPKPNAQGAGLERLQARFTNSGVTHPQAAVGSTSSVQTAEQKGQLPPPRPVRQASFETQPIATESRLTRESFFEGQPEGAEYDEEYGDEYGYEEEDEPAFSATLDKPLFSRKSAGEEFTGEDEGNIGGWTNKLAKPELTPLLSVGGSLLIVLAAFFLLAVLLRKISPQGNRPLPKEAFECIGRYFLTQKHQVQVLRMGNRIVLVSVMPDGVSTLAEITDPDEAVAFLGLCRRLDNNSATEMFRKSVASMSEEELNRPYDRPATTRQRERRGQLDLYSDPDESLASILARGRSR